MSAGGEREFIDYLQRKEGKTMKCPLLLLGWDAARGGDRVFPPDCLKEECAWWDNTNGICALLQLGKSIYYMGLHIAAAEQKMPHELQFRK